MKLGLNRQKALLLVLLLCALGALAVWRRQEHQPAPSLADQAASAPPADGTPGADRAAIPPSVMAQPPASPWMEQRTRRYAALFKDQQCDVLLVPVQVEGAGFDRPSRNIMSGELAAALAAGGKCVADPFLVDIALGDGMRRRADDEVLALARTIKASRVLYVYAGHYAPGQMRVTMQLSRAEPGATPRPAQAHSFDQLAYTDEHPPFLVFRDHLPEMLAAMGLAATPMPVPVPAGTLPVQLPDTFGEFLHPAAAAEGPLAQSARLTFLATLAPYLEWRATDRLYSKAWLALQSADAGDPAVRLLRARILFHLHERPLALATIKDDPGPAADGLRALLDGNLPQARQAFAQVKDPWQRFLLGVDVHDLEVIYGRDPRATAEQVMALVADSPFRPFTERRLGDRDEWSLDSTGEFEALLQQNLPLGGVDLTQSSLGRTAMALFDQPELELAALRHVHRLVEEQPRLWCCTSFTAAPRASDLLDLLDSRIEHTLGRQAYFQLDPQGQPEKALHALNGYDAELAGAPCAEELSTEIYWELMGKRELGQREELNRKMHEAARATVWWSQGQLPDTNLVLWAIDAEPRDPIAPYVARLTEDYPIRSYWKANLHVSTAAARLAFSSEDTAPLKELLSHSTGADRAAYLAELQQRFLGDPYATQLVLDNPASGHNTPESLQAGIANDPDNWQLYRALGRLQLADEAYSKVQETILSFPAFHQEHPNDPVKLSNYVSGWGEDLLWLGAATQARPLLQKAADYQTGSAAGNYAAARLALLDGRYAEAAQWFSETASAYDDFLAYRELICLMFAAGLDRQGWSAFDHIAENYRAPAVFTAAMVGHRRARLAGAQLDSWYSERLAKAQAGELRNDLRSSAFLEQVVDRALGADVAPALAAMAAPGEAAVRPGGEVYLANTSPGVVATLGPSAFGRKRHSLPKPGEALPDRYATAAAALAAVQAGHYEDAVTSFDRLGAYYGIFHSDLDLVFPYFAFAAAKTGDKLGLRQFVEQMPADENYQVLLARAVFAAVGHQPEAAQALLRQAFHDWYYDHGDNFPLSAYKYMATCTLLYEDSHDEQYRQAALRLARVLRRVEPSIAYGHALVAYLGDEPQERSEALGMALYLDPDSYWASKAPAALRKAAQARLDAGGNPFRSGDNQGQWAEMEAAN